MNIWIDWVYIVAALLFGVGLKMLSSPETARRGNMVSAVGMLLAVVVTLFNSAVIDPMWIAVGLVIGGLVGALAARLVAMMVWLRFASLAWSR